MQEQGQSAARSDGNGLISCSERGCNFRPRTPSATLASPPQVKGRSQALVASFTSRKNSLWRAARGVTQGRALTSVYAIKTGASPLAVQGRLAQVSGRMCDA